MPVYVHVISDGAIGNVSDKAIADQIRVMNLAFAGFYGGADSGFSFTLAGTTRTDTAAWFNAGPSTSQERDMKRTLLRAAARSSRLLDDALVESERANPHGVLTLTLGSSL